LQIDKLRGKQLDQLFDAILSLKDREECYRFFDDIATMSEIQSISQRLQVAKMLTEGQTYSAIEQETKASTATISRVRRCINYGSDGYQMVLGRILDDKETEK
jgi:TrpR-related protein YerC/YecD